MKLQYTVSAKLFLVGTTFAFLKNSVYVLVNICVCFVFKLCFDFFVFIISKQKNNKNSKNVDASVLGLKEVKDIYKDVDDYLATFEPLLFEEVKAQIIQKKDDEEGVSI